MAYVIVVGVCERCKAREVQLSVVSGELWCGTCRKNKWTHPDTRKSPDREPESGKETN